jgi:hypothetical protein
LGELSKTGKNKGGRPRKKPPQQVTLEESIIGSQIVGEKESGANPKPKQAPQPSRKARQPKKKQDEDSTRSADTEVRVSKR